MCRICARTQEVEEGLLNDPDERKYRYTRLINAVFDGGTVCSPITTGCSLICSIPTATGWILSLPQIIFCMAVVPLASGITCALCCASRRYVFEKGHCCNKEEWERSCPPTGREPSWCIEAV